MIDRWALSIDCQEELESKCWKAIRAPPGIVPPSNKPFTVPSTLNMSQWITLTQVSSKYLLSQAFGSEEDLPILTHLCNLMDYVSACLMSGMTAAIIADVKRRARLIAGDIPKFWPRHERSMVLHMLVFHLPQALEQWGPARGFWVFAYERSV